MNKLDNLIVRTNFAFILFIVIAASFCSPPSYASDQPQPGDRYNIVQPMYLMAVYNSLNDRQLSRETARAFLYSIRHYEKSWVAFQSEVPVGTIMTIIGPAPKVWNLPFLAKRYFVQLEPDLSRGLDVVLELNRAIEGDLDGLNSKLFSRMKGDEMSCPAFLGHF